MTISVFRLHEAITWCNWVLANGAFVPNKDSFELDLLSPNEWTSILASEVERLSRVRSEKLRGKGTTFGHCVNCSGSVLVFYPNFSMHDGLLQLQSQGLFDAHGCPLNDFWIGMSTDHEARLFSWIPQPLKKMVDEAMKVDAAKCLAWLGEGGAMSS